MNTRFRCTNQIYIQSYELWKLSSTIDIAQLFSGRARTWTRRSTCHSTPRRLSTLHEHPGFLASSTCTCPCGSADRSHPTFYEAQRLTLPLLTATLQQAPRNALLRPPCRPLGTGNHLGIPVSHHHTHPTSTCDRPIHFEPEQPRRGCRAAPHPKHVVVALPTIPCALAAYPGANVRCSDTSPSTFPLSLP